MDSICEASRDAGSAWKFNVFIRRLDNGAHIVIVQR